MSGLVPLDQSQTVNLSIDIRFAWDMAGVSYEDWMQELITKEGRDGLLRCRERSEWFAEEIMDRIGR